jgi:hypothetical protein
MKREAIRASMIENQQTEDNTQRGNFQTFSYRKFSYIHAESDETGAVCLGRDDHLITRFRFDDAIRRLFDTNLLFEESLHPFKGTEHAN